MEIEEKCPQLRMIWISCAGDTAADVENLGPVSYAADSGFEGYYFPFLNQMHYLRLGDAHEGRD